MANEPNITIIGNLTGDPELRFTQAGIPVANFTVASTPRTLNRQSNQWEYGEAMFVRCSVWREYGENVAETLTKGTRVIVTGKLTVRSYEHNGQQRTSLELAVDEIGPALRYARAQVTKLSGNHGGYNTQQSAGGYGGQATYNAPQGGSDYDPWAAPPQDGTAQQSALNDMPPF
ncbi:single-stranded DNA-binding protein [Actinobaculum sp. 352]|uniref:single-stranded DNA-binding protein n=1 Tax=Actinobaculum sp. 352 TaxID=2490946 RepID=UPI000F7DD99B|nr:single-stranded DNA-binding protein [Actinobaculum sp. 352]RTE47910.1 single-stranded DNA-binding protein [Actinobaculum sp. 352]